ncbi:MAG TPA: LysR family transcriptional regulator, partial [Acidimicrobiales bacterium]|nr:LysR family transcriptional regulator [Acidimicrobiales bacterium]
MPLPDPVPELASLDLLVSVSELGSISAAAGAHGITQPAASMRLRKLEQVLGIQLLERAATGSRLTPAGEATVEWAAPVLHGIESLLVGASALRRSARSSLRLAASMTVAEYLVPTWLGRLASGRGSPSVSLEMGNTAAVAGLVAAGRADLGFIEGARPPGRLSFRDLLEDELVVVVGPPHPWARRRRALSPAELARTALLVREEGSGTRQVL